MVTDELVRARDEEEDDAGAPEPGVTILGCAGAAEEAAAAAARELL